MFQTSKDLVQGIHNLKLKDSSDSEEKSLKAIVANVTSTHPMVRLKAVQDLR